MLATAIGGCSIQDKPNRSIDIFSAEKGHEPAVDATATAVLSLGTVVPDGQDSGQITGAAGCEAALRWMLGELQSSTLVTQSQLLALRQAINVYASQATTEKASSVDAAQVNGLPRADRLRIALGCVRRLASMPPTS